MNLHLDAAVGHAKVLEQIQGGHTSAVLRGIFREFAVVSGNFRDVQAGFVTMADHNFVTG